MKRLVLLASAILFLTGCASDNPAIKKNIFITINNHSWTAETVATPDEQELGLSNRESLPADHGMYFVFDNTAERTFWMKNMKFPLDIIWIKDDEVAGVDYGAMPEGEMPTSFYYSKGAINRVLEINKGEAMKYNIKKGDKIKINE